MAHKIKIHAVPHINRDNSVGTKKDYIVRCKTRGKVCTHAKFSTRREAEAHVSEHWEIVSKHRAYVSRLQQTKKEINRLPGVRMRIRVNVGPALESLRYAQSQIPKGVHAA